MPPTNPTLATAVMSSEIRTSCLRAARYAPDVPEAGRDTEVLGDRRPDLASGHIQSTLPTRQRLSSLHGTRLDISHHDGRGSLENAATPARQLGGWRPTLDSFGRTSIPATSPSTPAAPDAARTASFAVSSNAPSGKASSAMKRAIVKPMPATHPTTATCAQVPLTL